MHEILDHADALAEGFDYYEPSADDEFDIMLDLLRRAALNRAWGEREVAEAGAAARGCGPDLEADRHIGPTRPAAPRRTAKTCVTRLGGTWRHHG